MAHPARIMPCDVSSTAPGDQSQAQLGVGVGVGVGTTLSHPT